MTNLTATTAFSWCLPTITTNATASKPLQVSIVSKSGTRNTDSERDLPLTVLREIPTGISSHHPPDAVDDFYTADDDNTPSLPHPYLSPKLEERSLNPQLFRSPAAVDEPFEYRSQLVELTALFDLLKQRRPPPTSIDPGHSIIPSDIIDLTPDPSPPSPLAADDDSFDFTSKLVGPTAATARTMHRWPLPSAPSSDLFTPPLVLSPTKSTPATPPAHTLAPPYLDPSQTATSPASNVNLSAARTDDPNDRTLLAATTALDNFLLQYPRQLNLPDNIPQYQPSHHQRPSLCRHTLFAQQTAVLCTMSMLLAELCKIVSLFIEASALSANKRQTPIYLKTQLSPYPPRHPAPHKKSAPVTFPRPFKHIPAKPPFLCSRTPAPTQTKDCLHPPSCLVAPDS